MNKNKLDPNELKKNIFNSAIQHPLTLFPTGVAFLGGLGFALFDITILAGVAGAGLVVGTGAWCYNYFNRKDYFTDKYVKELQAQMKKEREQILDDIDEQLMEMANHYKGTAKEHALQCIEQLQMSKDKFEAFIALLDRKLNRGELTYNRFLVSVEQTYLALLDNLNKVAELFVGIKSIDQAYIKSRLTALRKQGSTEAADIEEEKLLLKRQSLFDNGLVEINNLITENERALTTMNEVMLQISRVKMMKGQADVAELTEALTNLEEIGRQSQSYSVE